MKMLVFADPFHRPTPSRFTEAGTEDRYYRAHEPKRSRHIFPIALAVAMGYVALSFTFLPL